MKNPREKDVSISMCDLWFYVQWVVDMDILVVILVDTKQDNYKNLMDQ